MMKLLILIIGIILCIMFPPLIVFVGIGCVIYLWSYIAGSTAISVNRRKNKRSTEENKRKSYGSSSNSWVCRNCGESNPNSQRMCKNCGDYK